MPVLTAILGLVGVLVGAFVTQRLAISSQRRKERLEAIVELAAACARVIGAHERIFELFADGKAPPPTSDVAHSALLERTEAHSQWRAAQARVEILVSDEAALKRAVDAFGEGRAAATKWVLEYQRLGEVFSLSDYGDEQIESWRAMRGARYELIKAGQEVSLKDRKWLSFVLRDRIGLIYTGLDSVEPESSRP